MRNPLWVAASVAIGAGLVYFLDPRAGARRRRIWGQRAYEAGKHAGELAALSRGVPGEFLSKVKDTFVEQGHGARDIVERTRQRLGDLGGAVPAYATMGAWRRPPSRAGTTMRYLAAAGTGALLLEGIRRRRAIGNGLRNAASRIRHREEPYRMTESGNVAEPSSAYSTSGSSRGSSYSGDVSSATFGSSPRTTTSRSKP